MSDEVVVPGHMRGATRVRGYRYRRVPPAELFWAQVRKTDGCWLWTGSANTNGYGQITVHGRNRSTHRFAWQLEHGNIPRGLCVCHTCDVKLCVRVSHLFLGTIADNNRDAARKGRTARGDRHGSRTRPERLARGERHGSRTKPEMVPRGERSPCAKLTERDVRELRARYAAGGVSQPQLAREYGVTQGAIWCALQGRTWKHLNQEQSDV